VEPSEALAHTDASAKERRGTATAPEAASWLIDPAAQTNALTVYERLAALLPKWEAEPEWKEPA
jgi:hypothetical protein